MNNVTATDMLKIHGKWIDSEAFISLMAERRGISERQAYRDIKEAVKRGEIQRIELPNRHVIYGLGEFGPHTGFLSWLERRAESKENQRHREIYGLMQKDLWLHEDMRVSEAELKKQAKRLEQYGKTHKLF